MGIGASTATIGEPNPNNNQAVVVQQPLPPPPAAAAAKPAATSCYKKKSFDDDGYWDGFKEHVNGFCHASWDDHKKCFKSKYQKVFKRSEAVADQGDSKGKGGSSSLPLGTTSTTLVKG